MKLIEWLSQGDVSIRYQVLRDLLGASEDEVNQAKQRIHQEGWGKRLLDLRDPKTLMWGGGIYSPKFISTHYTLLELKNLGIDSTIPEYQESANLLIRTMWQNKKHALDMCVSAMILSIVTYGKFQSQDIREIVDYILQHQYPDGGWNCRWQKGDIHSSLHTTLSVLEAFHDYEENGYQYRIEEIRKAVPQAREWILSKKLFRSFRTNEIINPQMLICPYPSRWKYDILRALDFFASIHYPYDERMKEALSILISRMDEEGRMPQEKAHPGKIHFRLERSREKSRWNTLRMLRVLKEYDCDLYHRLLYNTSSEY
jgi:hypothetical protein